MKIISWNVNGVRSVLRQGFEDFVRKHKPDILALQEVRVPDADYRVELQGYQSYWSAAEKKGYAGTAIFARRAPLKVTRGIGIPEHDREGRVLTAEWDDFFLVNVYVPNAKRDLSRLAYRQKWDRDFLAYLKRLKRKKGVIFCGDMNVAHQERDLTYPKANVKNHGFTPEEREGFTRLLAGGFVDSFRMFNQEGGHYSWWSRLGRCRERNIGWRIDYVCVSESLRARVKSAFILKEVMGSDHCPVGVELKVCVS